MSGLNKNFIAGDWVAGSSEIKNRNPSDLSDLIGLYAQASPDQLDTTLAQAQQAQREWAAYGIERKYNVLMAIGTEMMARAQELGTLLSREEGKPVAEGKGEVYRAGQFFTYYAAETLRQMGETAESVLIVLTLPVLEALVLEAAAAPSSPRSTARRRLAGCRGLGARAGW